MFISASACAILFAAYWFTRPPELVWWTAPQLYDTGRTSRVLIPNGWELKSNGVMRFYIGNELVQDYQFVPVDRRPSFLRRLFPSSEPRAFLVVMGGRAPGLVKTFARRKQITARRKNGLCFASRYETFDDEAIFTTVSYCRESARAFNRTYKQICDSLTIE